MGFRIVSQDFAGLNLVNPAVDREITVIELGANNGIGSQVIDLSENVFGDKCV